MMNFIILSCLLFFISCASLQGQPQTVTLNAGGPQLDEAELQKRFFERAR